MAFHRGRFPQDIESKDNTGRHKKVKDNADNMPTFVFAFVIKVLSVGSICEASLYSLILSAVYCVTRAFIGFLYVFNFLLNRRRVQCGDVKNFYNKNVPF